MFTGTALKSVDQLSPSQCKVSSGTNDRQNISLVFESITILQHMPKYIAIEIHEFESCVSHQEYSQ